MKRIFCLAILVLLCVYLAACGRDVDIETPDDNPIDVLSFRAEVLAFDPSYSMRNEDSILFVYSISNCDFIPAGRRYFISRNNSVAVLCARGEVISYTDILPGMVVDIEFYGRVLESLPGIISYAITVQIVELPMAADYIERVLFIPARGEELDFSQDAADTVDFVEAVHPNFIVHGRMCLDEYKIFREIYLAATENPMTHTEFTLATQRFLTVFNDGHLSRTFLWIGEESGISMFQDGDFIDRNLLSRNGRLFLADDSFVITETEVLAIGGVPVAEIFAVIDYYFGAYNEFGVQRARGRYARYQLMLQLAGAELFLCAGGELVVDITIINAGIVSVVTAGFTPVHPSSYRTPSFEPPYISRWEMKNDDVFYMSLRSLDFAHEDANFALWDAVWEAAGRGVRNFIIDLRNTPGGNPRINYYIANAMGVRLPTHGKIIRIDDFHRESLVYAFYPPFHLERYTWHLTNEDFRGRDYIYVPRDLGRSHNPNDVFVIALTSERTFSGGTTIAAEIADSGFGKIIGEPSPTSPTGYGFGRALWLPESRLQIRPHYTFYLRPDAGADQNVLWPDILVYEWEALDVALDFFASFRR